MSAGLSDSLDGKINLRTPPTLSDHPPILAFFLRASKKLPGITGSSYAFGELKHRKEGQGNTHTIQGAHPLPAQNTKHGIR